MTQPIPMLVLLSRRDPVSPADFRAYWQDVHGPLAARLAGLHHYRQLHVSPARGWWPETAGLDLEPAAADRIDGIADMAFASADGQKAYAAVAHFTRSDEINLFRRSVRYLTDAATCEESAQRIASAREEGGEGLRLCALLRRRADCTEAAFCHGLRELFAPLCAAGAATVWTLAPRDNSQNHLLAANVDHDAPAERQYQAVLELGFESALEARSFFSEPAFAKAQAELVAAAHVYRIDQVAPMLLQGRMTLSGRRGHSVAQLIVRTGAVHQLQDAVAAKFK